VALLQSGQGTSLELQGGERVERLQIPWISNGWRGASRACATSTRNLASACRTGAETQPRATHEVRSALLALDFVARPFQGASSAGLKGPPY